MPDTVEETLTVPYLKRSDIEDRSREVLKLHHLMTIPIDPVVLAHREGIKINNAKFTDGNVVGMIIKCGDEVSMFVNQNDPPFRKRFTIAHELGHHFLHMTQDGEFVDKDANLFRRQPSDNVQVTQARRLEIQANMFAASLLMPQDEVQRYWLERNSLEDLAKIFHVSEEAMGYRIDSLGLE